MSGLPSPLKSATTMEWGPEPTAKVLAVKNIVACSASALPCEAITIRDIALTISLEGTLNLLGRTGSNKPRVRERVGIRGKRQATPRAESIRPIMNGVLNMFVTCADLPSMSFRRPREIAKNETDATSLSSRVTLLLTLVRIDRLVQVNPEYPRHHSQKRREWQEQHCSANDRVLNLPSEEPPEER